MPKGNDGKAAQKQQYKAIALIILFCCLTGYAYYTTHPEVKARRRDKRENKKFRHGKRARGGEGDARDAAFGNLHLIELRYGKKKTENGSKYDDVVGQFCKLAWGAHKKDPSSVPMFRDLVSKSRGCDIPQSIPLRDVVQAARKIDEKSNERELAKTPPHSIPPAGFVFHESRCGSTLVANSLAAVDPEKHRVYSESSPLISAMKMVEGDESEDAKQFVQDVVYIMGRTHDPKETRLFYKIQSIGTTFIRGLRQAFPDVPWIFVYRDPVQVMMSHMPKDTNRAVCLRTKSNPPPKLRQIISDVGDKNIGSLSNYEMCAAHLSYLCKSIIEEQQLTNTGRMVNYDGLTDKLLKDIFPNYFGIPVTETETERVLTVGTKYSKGRGQTKEWKEDSTEKDKNASPELKNAAEIYLSSMYQTLTTLESKF